MIFLKNKARPLHVTYTHTPATADMLQVGNALDNTSHPYQDRFVQLDMNRITDQRLTSDNVQQWRLKP